MTKTSPEISKINDGTVVSSHEISMQYGDQTVLSVPGDFYIPRGLTVITGPSGSGKSTYLNVLAGFTEPTTGTVTHYSGDGTPVFKLDPDRSRKGKIFRTVLDRIFVETPEQRRTARYRSRGAGYIGQEAKLHPGLTMGEHIRLVQEARGNRIDPTYLTRLTEYLGIDELLGKRPSELSGGEEQRGAIVCALTHRPHIIFADEPTSALDRKSGEKTLQLFRDTVNSGTSIIMVSHAEVAVDHADNLVKIDQGEIVEARTLRPN